MKIAKNSDVARPNTRLTSGTFAPVAVVSSGTVAQLSDAELCAALLHERGHARRRDPLIAAFLAFATDLLPLPSRDLVALYREAREFGAVLHALRSARAHGLASALLVVARARRGFAALSPLQGEGGVEARLRALLDGRAGKAASVRSRAVVLAVLLTTCVAGIHPIEASASAVTAARSTAVVVSPPLDLKKTDCEPSLGRSSSGDRGPA